MVQLRKIQSDLFTNLHDTFLREDDPLSNEQDWRNVFDYQWKTEFDHCGYALVDGDEVVGMIGMVFSERLIDGTTRKFCNLHTWWVRPDHRGRSLALLRPVLKLDDYTITHFTPDDEVRAVAQRLGFQELNSQLKMLLPRRRGSDSGSDLQIMTDPQSIQARLSPSDRKIFADHQPYGLRHLLVQRGDVQRGDVQGDDVQGDGDSCYLIYAHVVRHRLPYCHIHYISNHAIFERYETVIRSTILGQDKANFVAVDRRLIDPSMKLRRSFNFWAPAHGLYKSTSLQPDQIDHLYSDVAFLKLTTMPDISHELRRIVHAKLPFSK